MNEIIKLDEIGHQMERGLDGLGLFLDTWDNVRFQPQPGGEVLSYSMAKEAAETVNQVEDMYSLSLCGHAYLAGWNTALEILERITQNQANSQECATSATSAASPSHNE